MCDGWDLVTVRSRGNSASSELESCTGEPGASADAAQGWNIRTRVRQIGTAAEPMLGGSHGVSDLVRTGTSGARKKERPEKRPAPGVYVHTLRPINIQQFGVLVEGFLLDAASHVQLSVILKCAVSPGGNGMQHPIMHVF